MNAVILAGGLGTRLSEETHLKPKPMVEIGGYPILWHIMKIFSSHGINEFIICLGYKGYVIKEYFANYFLHMSDVTFDLTTNEMCVHHQYCEPWKVTLVDTGVHSMTGGRLRRIRNYLSDDDFCFTYGDGVSDVNVTELINFHREMNAMATVTAVQPPGRFGSMEIEANKVISFQEKPLGDGSWINGGFFVLSPKVIEYIKDDNTIWEREPLEALSSGKRLSVYKHSGFWQAMDTLRDKEKLEELWRNGQAPWKTWTD